MRSALVLDGRFRVTDEGDVFRQKNGGEYPASVCYLSRSHNIPAVSYSDGGHPVVAYVSRMVADAFLPNPGGLPLVLHLDGNPRNNHVDNLAWGTNSDRLRRQYDSGKMEHPCKICGASTLNHKRICNGCKMVQGEIAASARRKAQIAARRAYAAAILSGSPARNTSVRNREIMASYASGLTLADVARKYSLSRERVRQIVSGAR